MYLLSYFIHSVLMGTLILYNTSLSLRPRLTSQRDAGEISQLFGTIAKDFATVMGTFDNYTEAYKNFQREVDETPAENSRLHNMIFAFNDAIQKKSSKLPDFAGGPIQTTTVWPTLYSFASDLPKLHQNLDDLIEISGPNYGQHLFAIQKSLEEMGKKVGNVLETVAGYRVDTNVDEVIRQIEVGASTTTDLFNRPGLAHWDRDELVEIVVVVGNQRAGFQKTLSFLLSLSDVPGRVAGLKTLHLILTASGEIYDQGLIFVLGVHLWGLRSSAEGAEAFAQMPTVLQTIFSQGARNFNFCIRGDLYCCIQIVPIYPNIPSLKDMNMVTCLGKSELDYLKLPVNPVHFDTGFQITTDQNEAQITLYLEECRDCNCRDSVSDRSGLNFFCQKSPFVDPVLSPTWKIVLKRGNGFQLQSVDNYTITNGGVFDPKLPTLGKWAGICEKSQRYPKSQIPHRIPCFADKPQTLYTSRYPPTE